MQKLMYNYKGNAANLKGQLDEKKKKDLRTNHFTIGGKSANVTHTVQSLTFRPQSAFERKSARPMLN